MTSSKKIRVFVADDHQILRQGIKKILEETCDIEVAGEAKSGMEVLQKIRSESYDVLLLDISMPSKGGIDILAQVRHKCPAMSVLVLSTHPEEQYAVPAIRAGAAGYLTKESAPESLVSAIRRVAKGLKYISAKLAARLADVASQPDHLIRNPHERLSDRERQVMIGIAEGHRLTTIAQNISLSVKTISTYRGRVLYKMQLSNNAELTRYALTHNLIHERLSDRERQVLIGLAEGHSLTTIAQNINLSVKTVRAYRSKVLGKMQLSNNADLTRYALIHKLI